ncbi:hypothetical protein GCM10023350_07940 [Nocardioides endophyticus]|uniref:Uncharacterized protein n=1 Tax=Nocardioides endophyticus TaxID=1353775 RepID=A0ABP8YE14_9ACTN
MASPVDFVWSSVGSSDLRTASRPISSCAREEHHGPRHGEDAAQQQGHDRQLDDGAQDRPEREEPEPDARPPAQPDRERRDREQPEPAHQGMVSCRRTGLSGTPDIAVLAGS